MIAAVGWMVHQAPDSSRSIRRFRQARRSLAAQGGRRHRPAADTGGSAVVVMAPPIKAAPARRTRLDRTIDLRDDAPGPARWPADGWSLGSEALAPVKEMPPPPPAPTRSNEPRFAVKPHFAAEAPIPEIHVRPQPHREARPTWAEPPRREVARGVLREPAPARAAAVRPEVTRAEAIRAELSRSELVRAEAIRVEALRTRAATGDGRTHPPAHPPAHQSARRAAPVPAAESRPDGQRAPRPPAPRPPRPARSAPAGPQREGRPEGPIDDRPRHAAISGGRPRRQQQPAASRGRHQDDPPRWRVIDLSGPPEAAPQHRPEPVLAGVGAQAVLRLDSLRSVPASPGTSPATRRRVGEASYSLAGANPGPNRRSDQGRGR